MLETIRYPIGSVGASGFGSKSTARRCDVRDRSEIARVRETRSKASATARCVKVAEDTKARIVSEFPDSEIVVMALDLAPCAHPGNLEMRKDIACTISTGNPEALDRTNEENKIKVEAIEQIEDILTGLKVLDLEGNCIRLSLKTFLPTMESLLCQQKMEYAIDPTTVDHELVIEVSDETMELKNVEFQSNWYGAALSALLKYGIDFYTEIGLVAYLLSYLSQAVLSTNNFGDGVFFGMARKKSSKSDCLLLS
ncbi:hypothetical protein Scep_010605 [Stephania cephalantha]|uniref:Uncharacterized protein n=1 Tax=Stephania cephalantha TaxID=152367 RepID=A0AAP0JW38_9MAGN